MEEYICKECGKTVIIKDGKVERTCDHTGTIIATMTAVATGISKLEQ